SFRNIFLRDEKGFTLIEVLTVAAMIAILATVALASMRRSKEAAYESQAIGALRTLTSMEYVYFFDHRQFGNWDDLQGEGDLVDVDYIKSDDLNNPFDHPIALKYSIYFTLNNTRSDFTIYAIPQPSPQMHLRPFSVYGDGAINGAGFEMNPTSP
ncbi:type II secretion system GspH family protein, partial [bacterium]|nr:type II secretion system GspH family protein [bacterium]MBU1026024.1 type II secretion system GspH family protein [bacterium]